MRTRRAQKAGAESPRRRCANDLDHGVLVGYEADASFWRVINSEGEWGERGYVRIERDDTYVCGILKQTSSPGIGVG